MPSFETPGPITATIDVVVGDVRIIAGDGATTVVDVRPSDAGSDEDRKVAERTRVEHAGEVLIVKAPKLRSWLPRTHGGSIDVTVELPAGSQVYGTGQLTDFHAAGELGDTTIKTGLGQIQLERAGAVNLKTGIGDITVGRASGHADINAGSGEARVRELGGSAVVKNSNGDTWIGEITGNLRVNAANGRISVDRACETVAAKSANGDVRLGEVGHGTVLAETALGKVEIGIRDGVAAWLDLNTRFGSVHNDLGPTERPGPGEDAVEVRARTSFGDITINRSVAADSEKDQT